MKLLVEIDEETYKDIKKGKVYSSFRDVPQESVLAIANGTPIPDNATPCDFCRYNPPSSTDGKPCCMCPATGRGK